MILFNIGVFLTSKILEHTIDDIFYSSENPRSMSLQVGGILKLIKQRLSIIKCIYTYYFIKFLEYALLCIILL